MSTRITEIDLVLSDDCRSLRRRVVVDNGYKEEVFVLVSLRIASCRVYETGYTGVRSGRRDRRKRELAEEVSLP